MIAIDYSNKKEKSLKFKNFLNMPIILVFAKTIASDLVSVKPMNEPSGMEVKHGVETNCLMGNLLVKEGAECKPYRDVKIKYFKTKDQLLKKIGESECFSIFDEAIGCGIGKYLEELFPEKCKYEK